MENPTKADSKAVDMTPDPFDFDPTDVQVHVEEMEISPHGMGTDCGICIGTYKGDESKQVWAYVRPRPQGGVTVAYRMNVPEEYVGHRLRMSLVLGRESSKKKDKLRGDVVKVEDITLFPAIEQLGDSLQLSRSWKLSLGDTSGMVDAQSNDQTSGRSKDSMAPSLYLHRLVSQLGAGFGMRCYYLNEHGAKVFLGDKNDAYGIYMRKRLTFPYWRLNERLFRKWINAGNPVRPALTATEDKSAAALQPGVEGDSDPHSESKSGTKIGSNSGNRGKGATGTPDEEKVNGTIGKSQEPQAGDKRKAENGIEKLKKRAREDAGPMGLMARSILKERGISIT